MWLAMLLEGILHHAEEVAGLRAQARLLRHFADERLPTSLAELDVASRQIASLSALRPANEQPPFAHAHSARNRFDSRKFVFVHPSASSCE